MFDVRGVGVATGSGATLIRVIGDAGPVGVDGDGRA